MLSIWTMLKFYSLVKGKAIFQCYGFPVCLQVPIQSDIEINQL